MSIDWALFRQVIVVVANAFTLVWASQTMSRSAQYRRTPASNA